MGRIAVLLVDDHPVVREGVKMLLSGATDLVVAGEVHSGEAALQALGQGPVDVVLLDLDLGAEGGVVLLPRIASAAPTARVLVLTGLRDRDRHRQALLAGARGLLLKDKSPEQLLKAIRKVHAGELWFERAVLEAALQRAVSSQQGRDPVERRIAELTARELEVVRLIGEGLKNRDIAEQLGISEKTVRNHLSMVFDKLGVSDRLELLVFAYRHGLAQPPR